MKITDLYENQFLTDKDKILKCMKRSFVPFDMDKLTIEPDGLVYDGDLKMKSHVTELKVQFKEVTGHLLCRWTNLINLKGSPRIVGKEFSSSYTNITSLEGCPKTVGGYFNCYQTNITSLRFCPQSISEEFYCGKTKIMDPREYRYALYCEIGGRFDSTIKEIDKIINTYGGKDNRKYWPHAINLLSKVQL